MGGIRLTMFMALFYVAASEMPIDKPVIQERADTYMRTSLDTCEENGMKMISTQAQCEDAAKALSLVITPPTRKTNTKHIKGRPHGCIYADNDKLFWYAPEDASSASGNCGVKQKFKRSKPAIQYDCICAMVETTPPVAPFYGWKLADCGGIDISGHGQLVDSEKECEKICDDMSDCTHAVYGGTGGKSGSSGDWWTRRCVPRSHLLDHGCMDTTWMRTYVKGKTESCGTLFDNFGDFQKCEDQGCVITLSNPADLSKGSTCNEVCQSQANTDCKGTAYVSNWCKRSHDWDPNGCNTPRTDDYMCECKSASVTTGSCGTLFDNFGDFQKCEDQGCVITLSNPSDLTKGSTCNEVCQSQANMVCKGTAYVSNWCKRSHDWDPNGCNIPRTDDYMCECKA